METDAEKFLRNREGSTRESPSIPPLARIKEGGLDDCSSYPTGHGYGFGGFADFAIPTMNRQRHGRIVNG